MDNHGQRLLRLEDEIKALAQQVAQLFRRVAALEQQMRSAGGGTGAGGGGGPAYFGATLSGILAAGSPGTALTGQNVWKISGGARVPVTSIGVLYNDTPNAIASGKQVLLVPNEDGTWTAIGVPC
jgi:hypothetical protein